MAKTIMVQGTCSNAGKSVLAAALCRIFQQDGYRTAPFKSQNMALNSFVTADGLEMGRAQAMQAEAAGIAPDVRMNPILLKPTSSTGSQVIVNGKPLGDRTAREYWSEKAALRPAVQAAFDSLAAEYDIIVIEGAGSPAEINLKQDDFVNMGLAKMVNAPVLLVGDIDRGGVFASLYGTVKLLEPDEQALIKGLIVNKFRGDLEILRPGLAMLEELAGKPVLGVVPFAALDLDDEDSLSGRLSARTADGLLDIVVIRLPHLSNFTDFSAFSRIPGVSLRYAEKPGQLGRADFVILPGTKSTLSDLKWLRQSGMEARLLQLHAAGTPVAGICGGYQMLGQWLRDPEGHEGGGALRGLGLLPAETVFRDAKTTVQARGEVLPQSDFWGALSGAKTEGYEIHMGETSLAEGAQPFQLLSRGAGTVPDGCVSGSVFGTYLHGVFDGGGLLTRLAGLLAERRGLALEAALPDPAQYREAQYDKLAALVREALDMERIYQILEEGKAL